MSEFGDGSGGVELGRIETVQKPVASGEGGFGEWRGQTGGCKLIFFF
jgi:hypothetical protein